MIPPPRNILVSYHYFRDYDLDRLQNLRIIGDSGAYSAKTQNAEVTTSDLAAWAKQWRRMATVAYRPSPGARIVGLSKLARVVVGYARRLQVQEQIGWDTVAALMDRLNPSGAAVLITASHDCMRIRGAREDAALTTTWAADGLLLDHERELIHQSHQHRVRDL